MKGLKRTNNSCQKGPDLVALAPVKGGPARFKGRSWQSRFLRIDKPKMGEDVAVGRSVSKTLEGL